MLQSLHVAYRRLVKQILNCAPVIQAPPYLRDEFIRNVNSKTATLNPSIEHMAEVLLTGKAGFAVLSNTARTAKTQGSEGRRPKAGKLFLKPIRNICGIFFLGWHGVYMPYYHIYSQVNSFNCFLCSNL
jgi:hypothetical protein